MQENKRFKCMYTIIAAREVEISLSLCSTYHWSVPHHKIAQHYALYKIIQNTLIHYLGSVKQEKRPAVITKTTNGR